jgi:hypothetical protein
VIRLEEVRFFLKFIRSRALYDIYLSRKIPASISISQPRIGEIESLLGIQSIIA